MKSVDFSKLSVINPFTPNRTFRFDCFDLLEWFLVIQFNYLYSVQMSPCADPESFARGCFFRGERIQISPKADHYRLARETPFK